MKKLQLASGAIIVVFAAVICIAASKLSFGTPRNPGPGFLPLAYGTALFFLALLFVLKTALQRQKEKAEESPWRGLPWKQVSYTLAVLLGYALLLTRLGYLVCTWMLMAFLFWGEGTKRRSYAVIASLAVSVATYLIFKGILKVRLPSGVLGF